MTVILVSGAPGTGKSTVAAAVGAGLGLPVLSLDPVKETLADVLGTGDEAWSDRLGDAAAELLFRLAPTFPHVVVEGWWRGARRERAIEVFVGAVEVFCRCDAELAARRMRARHGAGRHPIHRDMINPTMIDALPTTMASVTPLALGTGLVTVDTDRPDAAATAVEQLRAILAGLATGR